MKLAPHTRRQFLGGMAKTVLATTALPRVVPARVFGQNAPSNTLNLALIGMGGIMGSHLRHVLGPDQKTSAQQPKIVALCDVDLNRVRGAHGNPIFQAGLAKAKDYQDYRRLLDDASSFDAVLITTGCRWHVPLSKTFIKAGKHVYCEKPLARVVSEARDIKEVAATSKVATQLGTQGTATESFRRSVEVLQAGVVGPVREVHLWCNIWGPRSPSHDRPEGEDPVPEGLNWDEWLGPAPYRPFKNKIYLGYCLTWYDWYDFSSAMLAEFGQHNFMLPVRALKLNPPIQVAADVPEPQKETIPSTLKIRYEFAARGDLPPVTLHWYEAGVPVKAEAVAPLVTLYKQVPSSGCLFIGSKGSLFTDGWGGSGIMQIDGGKWRGVRDHEAAKHVAETEPRNKGRGHFEEWVDACKGECSTYCPLERGAEASEVLLPGIVSTRLGAPIDWEGAAMKVPGNPAADRFIKADYRTKWLI